MDRNRLEDQAEHPRDHADDDAAVDLFALDMKRKLAANVHKKHWDEVPMIYLYQRMLEEEEELYTALKEGNAQSIIDEAADVANFSMMLADRARRENKDIVT